MLLPRKLKVGLKTKGSITRISKYGVFAKLDKFQDIVLIHKTNIHDHFKKYNFDSNPLNLKLGDILDIEILSIKLTKDRKQINAKN